MSQRDDLGRVIKYCTCCRGRYAYAQYSRKGDLCEFCQKHYTDDQMGIAKQFYDWVPPQNLGKSSETPCNFCNLIKGNRSTMLRIFFECKDRSHSMMICYPCAEGHINSLRCPIDRAQITERSLVQLTAGVQAAN